MHLDKQHYKNQNMKNLPQRYNYSSNIAIFSFKQAKCCNMSTREFTEIMFSSASPPTGTDLEPILPYSTKGSRDKTFAVFAVLP